MTRCFTTILGAMIGFAAFAADPNGSPARFAAEFAKHWTATRKMAVGVAELMPPAQYAFQPDPGSMTFSQQISHIAQTNYSFCYGLKDSKMPAMPDATGKDSLVKLLGDSFDYCSAAIATLTEEDLDRVHSSPDGRLIGRECLLALYGHMSHHRGQMEVYLRDKGIPPPPYIF